MKPRSLLLLLICMATSVPVLNAQQPAVPTTFSVATIKPSQSPGWNSGFTLNGYGAVGVSLHQLLEDAFGLYKDRFTGGPPWIESEKFDVQAKIFDGDASQPPKLILAQRQQMLQNLLADRFKLVTHHTSKEVPAYSLVVNRNGSKLEQSTPEDARQSDVYGASPRVIRSKSGLLMVKGFTMEDLANFLTTVHDSVPGSSPQFVVGRLVVDKTGLPGRYNITLQWAPQGTPDNPSNAPGSSMFTALQEQLGLKLEPSKGTLDIVVVDHAEQPSEN